MGARYGASLCNFEWAPTAIERIRCSCPWFDSVIILILSILLWSSSSNQTIKIDFWAYKFVELCLILSITVLFQSDRHDFVFRFDYDGWIATFRQLRCALTNCNTAAQWPFYSRRKPHCVFILCFEILFCYLFSSCRTLQSINVCRIITLPQCIELRFVSFIVLLFFSFQVCSVGE